MVLLYIIQGFIFIYDVISYPFYYFIQKPWLVTERRERVKARQLDPSDPASPWERTPDSLSTASLKSLAGNNKCQNINQLFNEAVKIYANENCLGVRPVLEEKYKNGRLNKVVLADDYEWITYRDAELKVNYYAKGFKSCGIEKGDKVIMYADTCKEWFLASQSLFKIGAVMATLYTSLGTEEVAHGIHETQAKYVITNKKTLNNLLKIVTKLQNIKSIIVLDQKEVKEKENNNVNIVSLEEIELMGIGSKDDVNETITLDDVAFIMYTSGSSGKPKGVMLTHRNVLSAIKTLTTHLYSITEDSKNNIYVAYLPLAHILEFAAELIFFSNGIALGYSSTFTLTDKSPGIMQGQKGDLTILRPTIFITVPLVLERMKKAIIDKIEKQGSFLKVFFEFAIDYKYQWGLRGFITPILDFCIFNSIKNVLGGRVRLVSCGGAPLAQETHKFCNSCFGINIMQGYGSTETCSAISLIDIDDPTFENVGEPLPYTQIKLVDWPEGGYRVTDTPRPRGEILVYSDHVAKGYYQNDELTKEAFIQDSDGKIWFMTGDIGEMLEGGKLKIVDRKKDIVKLQHGEYISLGKVENALIMSEYVNNICVYCNPNESKPVALVLPNQFEIKRLIDKLDLDKEMSWENICQNEKVIKTVKDSLTEAAVAGGLKGFEIPSKFKLCSDEWNIDNGLLTPSLKIVRRSIYSFYKNEIDKMYREL